MKKILSLGLLLWIGSLLSAQTLFAQASTYDLRFINPQIDCYNQQFCIDIQIRNAGTDLMAIGSYTIFFHYNFQSINIPVYTGTHFNDLETCVSGFSPYMANAFGADTLTGDANITTLMQYPNLGCPLIDNNWIQMGYLCFDIINPEQSTQLEFDHGLTLFNLNDNYPAHIQGSLTNFDMLPDCNLLDSDNDGLSDAQEIVLNTNPLSPDTDMDGLPDFDEVTTHQTNPTMADTDTDGLSDSQEIDLNTNPLSSDTDMDGLPDFDEVTTHQTNPTMADTDTDGLSDSQEIDLNTNPLLPDTDMDSLSDGIEAPGGGPIDTDNDTIIDALDSDDDNDGLPTILEDANQNGILLDDDSDQDGLPNYLDPDPVGVLLPTAAANAPTIYPNPTSDLLQIELPQQYWANYCAIIYNLAGQAAAIKPLITKNISADNHNLIAQISIADLPVGTYMLYLNDEKNKTFFVCKVIKK